MPIDFEERVLKHIDRHYESLGDHCRRITTLEQDHKHRDRHSANRITLLLAGVVVLEFGFIVYEKVLMP